MFPLSNSVSEFQNYLQPGSNQNENNIQGNKRALHFSKDIELSDIFNHSDINKLLPFHIKSNRTC